MLPRSAPCANTPRCAGGRRHAIATVRDSAAATTVTPTVTSMARGESAASSGDPPTLITNRAGNARLATRAFSPFAESSFRSPNRRQPTPSASSRNTGRSPPTTVTAQECTSRSRGPSLGLFLSAAGFDPILAPLRRGGRAAEGSGLENRQGASPQEFESPPLRHCPAHAVANRKRDRPSRCQRTAHGRQSAAFQADHQALKAGRSGSSPSEGWRRVDSRQAPGGVRRPADSAVESVWRGLAHHRAEGLRRAKAQAGPAPRLSASPPAMPAFLSAESRTDMPCRTPPTTPVPTTLPPAGIAVSTRRHGNRRPGRSSAPGPHAPRTPSQRCRRRRPVRRPGAATGRSSEDQLETAAHIHE